MLVRWIPPGAVSVPFKVPGPAGKEDIIAALVDLLPHAADPELRREILRAVVVRERQMSTGIGEGLAIPHGTAPLADDLVVAAGVAPPPGLDFAAVDRRPVRLFFLLVARREARTAHLEALAEIARLRKDPERYERLLAAPDEAAFRAVLGEGGGR